MASTYKTGTEIGTYENYFSLMGHTQLPTVVFITGAFVHHSCWNHWKAWFESKGYETIASPWPHKSASPETLRNSHPNKDIAANRLSAITNHYDHIARQFTQPPILIGHSIGGLIVQLLLQRGLGSAGVAIHSVPPQGILTFKLSFLKAGWGPLGFFTSTSQSFLMSFNQWKYAFTNGMDCDAQKEAYYQYAIPESKLIVRDTITKAARVNYENPRAPLLLIAGNDDHTIPASLNHANYLRYKKSNSITDYATFAGRNHFVLGQPTWQEEAAYILDWLNKLP